MRPELPSGARTLRYVGEKRIAFISRRIEDAPRAPHEVADGMWTPYSFLSRHRNHANQEDFNLARNPGLRRKLSVGLAFCLAYYEHGNSDWRISNETNPAEADGILVWEHSPRNIGAKSRDDRQKDAQSFLDLYNAWCNGDVHGYNIQVYELLRDEKGRVILARSHYENVETPILDQGGGLYYGEEDLASAASEDIKAATEILGPCGEPEEATG